MKKEKQNILVIKLGALGDMVQAAPFFTALQQAYPDAHITLLTTPPFAQLAQSWGFFQTVWSEPRTPWWHLHKWLNIWRKLRRYDHIIDLQGVDRTRLYTWGHKTCCIPTDHNRHIRWRLQELADQLNLGELTPMRLPVNPHHATHAKAPLPKPYVMLIPGASKTTKCWPQENFIALAEWMKQRFHVEVIVIGQQTFAPELEVYKQQTSTHDIIVYGSQACLSIGNDTGPQLLAAAGGCQTLTFYGQHNPPTRGGPWGGWQLFSPNITHISLLEVQNLLEQHSSTWLEQN